MNFEIELTKQEKKDLLYLSDLKQYKSMESMFLKILEKNRDSLEKENNDFVRGDCKRLRKLLNLRARLVTS